MWLLKDEELLFSSFLLFSKMKFLLKNTLFYFLLINAIIRLLRGNSQMLKLEDFKAAKKRVDEVILETHLIHSDAF